MTPYLHIVRRSLSAALLLAVAGTGCASDPAAEDPPIDPTDDTAPQVVDTVPAANATGVTASEKIVVTFSERMDPATVESAYSSAQLPLDKVSLAWSADGTVLTISPDAPLLYAEGTGTDLAAVTRQTYAITIGAGAADLAGNPLGAPKQLAFATRRRLVAAFPLDLGLTYVFRNGTNLGTNTEIWAGDNAVDNTYRSYLSFNLAALPAGSEIEAAQFSARQLAAEGAPYNMGGVVAQHVSYAPGTSVGALQPLSVPGLFSSDATVGSKVMDVTSQVSDDVINRATRGDRSQFRLQIDQATNANAVTDKAVFAKATFEMTAIYLVD